LKLAAAKVGVNGFAYLISATVSGTWICSEQ